MPWLKRNDVSLFYEDEGGGDPPLLLVHGWGCDSTFMAPQFTCFCGNHRVVTVDLRGHGRSDKPRQRYTIPAFAEDLAWVCRERDLERPVVTFRCVCRHLRLLTLRYVNTCANHD